jgi:hypothetical protein
MPRSPQTVEPKRVVKPMEEQLIKTIEHDLRQVIQEEAHRFRDRYSECQKVDSIYLNEDVSIGVYDIQLHGLTCNHYLNLFVTSGVIYEFPEFSCFIVYEDKDADFKRDLAHILLLYTPITNRCYVKIELHDYEIRETAEHIIKTATAEEEMENEN